jgi:zinc-ribbon domain
MPYCPLCGAEIKPEKNFCTSCGSPLGCIPPAPVPLQANPPAVLPQASAPPPPLPLPGPNRERIIIGVVMALAILGIVMFIGLPLLMPQAAGTGMQTPQGTYAPRYGSPGGTLTPGVPSVTEGTAADSSTGMTVYRSGVAYDQVFSRNYRQDDQGVQDVFMYNLLKAPMLVECEMNPVSVSRQQLVDIDTANERYITSTYPDPNAWLDLRVIDADTGSVVNTISFSKNYRGELKQTYTVRANGNYRFELAGARVSPAVRLLVKQ